MRDRTHRLNSTLFGEILWIFVCVNNFEKYVYKDFVRITFFITFCNMIITLEKEDR